MPRSEPNAADVLASYRRWKEDGEALKARAQALLVERFASLVQEAQQLQHDLWEDFGQTVKFPVNPKFARKGKSRTTSRKARTSPTEAATSSLRIPANVPSNTPEATAAKPSASPVRSATTKIDRPAVKQSQPKTPLNPEAQRQREIRSLERKRSQAQLRLQQAQAEGNPTRIQNAEDRLYELNDDLRLLQAAE
jgi:hypothetical protein